MKHARNTWALYGVAIFWVVVAWIVVDYNLGLGTTTFRWRNPAHATPVWTWDAAEVTPTILEPAAGQWMRVTLPRGFSRATATVRTKTLAQLTIRGETPVGQPEKVQTTSGRVHTLNFSWSELVARGKTFRFRVENSSSEPVVIQTVEIITTR